MKPENSLLYQLNICISAALFSFSLLLIGINQSYANNAREYTAFGLEPIQAMPNPEARQYITTTKIENTTPRQFNGELNKLTDSVVISGHILVFEPGHDNGLWESYHQHKTLSDLEIHADTVIIRGALHLPQTNVTVYARVLRFEDDFETASINTTPHAAIPQQASPKQPGLDGDNGGNISLHINHLDLDSTTALRFILDGADGQKGGNGEKGDDAPPTEYVIQVIERYYATKGFKRGKNFLPSSKAMYVSWPSEGLGSSDKEWGDKNRRPQPGGDAIPPGISGDGGNAGHFVVPDLTAWETISSAVGGAGGVAAPTAKGGEAGTNGRHWDCDLDRDGNPCRLTQEVIPGCVPSNPFNLSECIRDKNFTAPDGRDAPGTAGTTGEDGKYLTQEQQYSWLTAPLFSQSLRYAKDLYMYGYYQPLDLYLNSIIEIVNAYQNSDEWNQLDPSLPIESAESLRDLRQAELLQLLNEGEMLQQRLQSGLDYFSKPFGWVPGLSFEVNQTVFDKEIDTAIDVLWLSHTLQQNINDKQARQNIAKQMVTELTDEINDLQQEYTQANDKLASLGPRVDQMELEIVNLQQRMDAYAESFRDDAEKAALTKLRRDNLFFLSRLNPLPDGDNALPEQNQPILQELGRISKDTVWNGAEIAMGEVDNALGCLADTGNPKRCAFKEGAKLVQEKIEQTKQQGQLLVDLIKGNTTNNATVNAELQKILAEDPGWLQYVEDMQMLHERKAELMADFIDALDTLNRALSDIGKNQLAIDVFQEEVINTTAILDPRVIAYTEDLAQRARHRLEQYQYYMVRSYEYRLLRPYPFALDLNAVFADLCRLQAANDSNDLESVAANGCQSEQVNLDENDFKNLGVIYKEQLSAIAEEIISEYNNGGGVSQDTALEFELPQHYLQLINQHPEGATLNLVNDLMLFNNSEEDLRIRSIEVIDMQFTSPDVLTYVDVSFKHSGVSQMRKGGESYLFQHYLNSDTSPIQWITRYNGNGTLQGLQNNSASSRSLIASIIGENAANLQIFASPGAWADLTIMRSASPSNSTQGVQITSMRIKVNYEYTPTENNIKTLHVVAESITQAPPIELLTEDINERNNGQGNFLRSFPRQTKVSLLAPQQYGQLQFEGWYEDGQLVSDKPRLDVFMDFDKTVLPRYFSPALALLNQLTELASSSVHGTPSFSRFFAGAKDALGNFGQQFSSTDKIDIVAEMQTGFAYQGTMANIYLVARYQGKWYMKRSDNLWTLWDLNVTSLLPHHSEVLTDNVAVTVQEGLSGLPGNFFVYVGHSSTDGNLHYNKEALKFSVQ